MLIGYGLIAGLTLEETMESAPGFVVDMYVMKRNYDDEQHGIKRKADAGWEE